ncbi:MAG: Stp1/IreP family PP2C-type Ser/Thr phosphatase [Bacillota bacterium]
MEWSAVSDRGLERENNEDGFLACPEIGLFAVADGMGGHQAGEVASWLALRSLEEFVRQNSGTDPRPLLVGAAEEANRRVYAASQARPEYNGMGSTLTACILQGEAVFWVHVGDSRGYLIRGGEITQFTQDHSLVSEFIREGKLTPEEAEIHPYRNVLSRVLGTQVQVPVDEGVITALPGDTILLCTDGLTIHLNTMEIMAVLSRGSAQDQAQELLRTALERGGRDNITLVLIRM